MRRNNWRMGKKKVSHGYSVHRLFPDNISPSKYYLNEFSNEKK
jgi:hypothetical protein